jgi:hypothetical protein
MADELWVPASAQRDLNQRSGAQNLTPGEKFERLRYTMGPRNVVPEQDPVLGEMQKNRRVNGRVARAMSKQGVSGFGGGASAVSFATGRPQDPMFYWEQSGLPYQISKKEELQKIREFARVLYLTHPLIASAIDIFSKYPLTGMELVSKDKAITEFYTDHFFDTLNYEEFLVDVLKAYWIDGEAWPFGSFNELLGVWEDDELLMPEDIEVQRSPFLKDPRLLMKLPETLRTLIEKKTPKWEYDLLMSAYPELAQFATGDSERNYLIVSNVLLKQLRFKAGPPNFPRGVPILLRGFRHIIQEQKLHAAVDAIADRLYTPLVLVRLGASATDLGTPQPWIPTEDDLGAFEDSIDAALAADFRVLVHHFATQIDTVFGKEVVPNLDADFDRLAEAQLQVFGMSKTMLNGSAQGETYAGDAINRDLVTQLLGTAQRMAKRLFKQRAEVVAEAQGHFDYEERGGKKYPIMEEVVEEDEETGEKRIVEQPKLLVPELKIKAMNMQDEAQHQQFVEALRASGVPISMKTRLINVPIDLELEIETQREEVVKLAVENQRTRRETYLALRGEGLPIPEDLLNDFEPKAMGGDKTTQSPAGEDGAPQLGLEQPAGTQAIVPTPEGAANADPNADPEGVPDEALGNNPVVVPLRPRNRSRPVESDEQRGRMPKASSYQEAVPEVVTIDEEGNQVTRMWSKLTDGPSSQGFRKRAKIDPRKSLEDQGFYQDERPDYLKNPPADEPEAEPEIA